MNNEETPPDKRQPNKTRNIILWILGLVLFLGFGSLAAFLYSSLRQKNVNDQQSITAVQQQQGASGQMHDVTLDNGRTVSLPAGFTIRRWLTGRGALRMMAVTDDGQLLVTEKDQGNVLSAPLADDQPAAHVMLSGLRKPSGIAFHDGAVWVAEENRVSRFPYQGGGNVGPRQVIVPDLPTGGHDTRTIGFGPDGRLYVTVGSDCNVCQESDPRRAAMLRFNADGSGMEIFATGLRNTVGFDWHPATRDIWGVDNGRDLIGEDLPPEEVNVIQEGKDYGWPYCYGVGKVNPEYSGDPSRQGFCQGTQFPMVQMQAHSAPLGVRFLVDTTWPMPLQQNYFIAFHGSWNRSVPTGYKVVRIGEDLKVYDFATGWLQSDGSVWGRPVDIIFANHNMYVSDDYSGTIYRISPE